MNAVANGSLHIVPRTGALTFGSIRRSVVHMVCWGCGVLSRTVICRNCVHTDRVHGTRVWLPERIVV